MNKLLKFKELLAVFLFILAHSASSAQSPIGVHFKASSLGNTIALEDTLAQDLVVNRIRYYICNLSLIEGGKVVFTDPTDYHLIDFEDDESMTISFDTEQELTFDAIQFQLGTDSLSNASGALEGALDPMHGMYWTWNSGYINFKIEGTSPQCNTRKNEFRYHIGGFQSPYQTVQLVQLPIDSNDNIIIDLNLDDFFAKVSLSDQPNIMQPGAKASDLAKMLPSFFSAR